MDFPAASQARFHSCNNHMPAMFFKNRVVPNTPPSLENVASKLFSEMIGRFNSHPINDHVPELKKTGSDSSAGTPTTAEAVSCPAGAIRSEEHTSELQSRVDISYAVFCLKKK